MRELESNRVSVLKRPVIAALVTFAVIVAAVLLRPELLSDPRVLAVVGFALAAALIGAAVAERHRWVVSAFLMAVGLGIVIGLHSPRAEASQHAFVPHSTSVR